MIGVTQPVLNTALLLSHSQGKGAQISSSNKMFVQAISSVVPSGLIPAGVTLVPLVPAGMMASSALLQTALSMGKGATIATTSKLTAQAISVLAPQCPPAGLMVLSSQLESALSSGKGAKTSVVCQQFSQSIIQYYLSGGVV